MGKSSQRFGQQVCSIVVVYNFSVFTLSGTPNKTDTPPFFSGGGGSADGIFGLGLFLGTDSGVGPPFFQKKPHKNGENAIETAKTNTTMQA